jgi:hypothetical protein
MQPIPERPQTLSELDLLKRLKAYSDGGATWHPQGERLGLKERQACQVLHANLVAFVEKCIHPLMDRVTSREMQTFTMHDHGHGLKVAHLMWHTITPGRRETLTPAEIALLITGAHFHDLGMSLNAEERRRRLSPDSDLWDAVEPESSYYENISRLEELANRDDTPAAQKADAIHQVQQAQEALLCIDTRERHAKKERYEEIIAQLHQMHEYDRSKIPDVHTVLSFDGDSFEEKLVDICVSHNQDPHVLLDRSPGNVDQWRFPIAYPVGCCVADTRLVAAALRVSDVLDFDRERTPPVLFYYLLPRTSDPAENPSIREWSKHLSISHWFIKEHAVVFRGRSPSAFIHHAVTEFCKTISDEITRTLSVFEKNEWPFIITGTVETEIEAVGYRYIPYRFTLNEERVHSLLMGRSIYPNPLDALRELIQNSVDACKLRDSLMKMFDNSVRPTTEKRITVRYEEPHLGCSAPVLSVIDTGSGMDRYIIENYFLKVGNSYYNSRDFLQIQSMLRRSNLAFNPISQFGIGFMAVFMLGDRVDVETAPWSSATEQSKRRLLQIDGIGRLIEVREQDNIALPQFHGTKVSVRLSSQTKGYEPPKWDRVEAYIRRTCKNIEYPLVLQHIKSPGITEETIHEPEGLSVQIPKHLTDAAIVIPVNDTDKGLLGEIVLYRTSETNQALAILADQAPIEIYDHAEHKHFLESGVLLRAGFLIGDVPGLPHSWRAQPDARVEVTNDLGNPKSLPGTNLARSHLIHFQSIEDAIFRIWFETLLQKIEELRIRPLGSPDLEERIVQRAQWLQQYCASQLYQLSLTSWKAAFGGNLGEIDSQFERWESGVGDAVWIAQPHSRQLHWTILKFILPKVCRLIVIRDMQFRLRYYISPPKPGWLTEFLTWHPFVAEKSSFGAFAEYRGKLEDLLYESGASLQFLNSRFQNCLSALEEDQVNRLFRVLDELMSAKEGRRPASLSSQDVAILSQIMPEAGHLKVGSFDRHFTLSELAPLTA